MSRQLKFRIYDKTDTKHLIGPFDWNNLPQFSHPENFIIQQFTGLVDSHGQEIYEGDIVSCLWQKTPFVEAKLMNFQVVFGEQGVNNGWNLMSDKYFLPLLEEFLKKKVIGDILKNPELLSVV